MVKSVDKNSAWYNKTGQELMWKHLPDTDEQTLFMRFVLDFWANPGKVGAAATARSGHCGARRRGRGRALCMN